MVHCGLNRGSLTRKLNFQQDLNERFGPKGQGTSLPPSPCTSVSGGGVTHRSGWHVRGGEVIFPGGGKTSWLVMGGAPARSCQAWTTVCSVPTSLFQRQRSNNFAHSVTRNSGRLFVELLEECLVCSGWRRGFFLPCLISLLSKINYREFLFCFFLQSSTAEIQAPCRQVQENYGVITWCPSKCAWTVCFQRASSSGYTATEILLWRVSRSVFVKSNNFPGSQVFAEISWYDDWMSQPVELRVKFTSFSRTHAGWLVAGSEEVPFVSPSVGRRILCVRQHHPGCRVGRVLRWNSTSVRLAALPALAANCRTQRQQGGKDAQLWHW